MVERELRLAQSEAHEVFIAREEVGTHYLAGECSRYRFMRGNFGRLIMS
jgi:hypothetical protein